jgi:hypothetical protein
MPAASQFNIIHHKNQTTPYTHVSIQTGVEALKNLKNEFIVVSKNININYYLERIHPFIKKTLIHEAAHENAQKTPTTFLSR